MDPEQWSWETFLVADLHRKVSGWRKGGLKKGQQAQQYLSLLSTNDLLAIGSKSLGWLEGFTAMQILGSY